MSKLHQKKVLRAELDLIGNEMATLRERLVVLERRGIEISSKLAHIEVNSRTGTGNPGRTIMRVAWKDFQLLTWRRNGVTTEDFFESLRIKVPGLRKATLRVYLHRLRERNLIEKRGSLWHRSNTEAAHQQ